MSSSILKLRIGMGIVILYSVVMLASAAPSFSYVSNIVEIIYYLLVPGYVLTLFLGEEYSIIERVAFSFALGIMVVLIIYSFNHNEQITAASLPFDLIIPILSIALVVIDYYRRSSRLI